MKFTKQERSWICYDWANSVYATNMLAAIFPIYFASVAQAAGQDNLVLWSYGTSAATFIVAFLSPFLGALGDNKGYKKKLFMTFLVLGVAFTFLCAITDHYIGLLIGYIVSHIGFSGANLFYDSFLTDVTTKKNMDKVSSWGFAMGYAGGSTIAFVISFGILLAMGASNPAALKLVFIFTSLWWLGFSIPLLKNVNQVHYVEAESSQLIKSSLANLKETFFDIIKHKRILFFLLAYFFYIDGVNTIISVSTSYGAKLGLDSTGMIMALLVTQIIAIPCSILFNKLSGIFGSINLLKTAVLLYLLITIVGFVMGYIIEVSPDNIGASQILFWILASMVGLVQGGIQAISRSYFGKLVPVNKSNEYFGFYDIFGKFAAVIGPLLVGVITQVTNSDAIGVLSLSVLFVLGFVFLTIGRKYFEEV